MSAFGKKGPKKKPVEKQPFELTQTERKKSFQPPRPPAEWKSFVENKVMIPTSWVHLTIREALANKLGVEIPENVEFQFLDEYDVQKDRLQYVSWPSNEVPCEEPVEEDDEDVDYC